MQQQPESLFFRRSLDDDDERNRTECFRRFDRRGDGRWDEDDCRRFVQALLGRRSSNMAAEALARELFARFERRIEADQFEGLWRGVVRPLRRPAAALIVVDVQNDFVSGSLAMRNCAAGQEGAEVVPVINAMIRDVPFATVAYSMDWHPDDHISFHDNLGLYELGEEHRAKDKEQIAVFDAVRFAGSTGGEPQTLWPKHCVQGTWGAQLHEDLVVAKEGAVVVKKGTERRVDSYSAFCDNERRGKTAMEAELRNRGITHAIVCGLALDFCVGYTALDSLTLGFPTVLVRDASRGTDEQRMSEMEAEIRSRNGVVANASEVGDLVQGEDIREEFVRVLLSSL